MTIQIDTREHDDAVREIRRYFDENGVKHFSSKLFVGDYMSLDNARFCVDRKQSLLEICQNVCQDHDRFRRELERANEYGIRLVFLIEHGADIRTLDDVRSWQNPRLKSSKLAVSGERLYKILRQLEVTYGTKFYFCTKEQTARGIIKLLKMNGGDRHCLH